MSAYFFWSCRACLGGGSPADWMKQSMLTQTLAEPQCSLQSAVACVGIGKGTTVAPALHPVLGAGIVLRSDSRLPELLRKSLTRPALPAAFSSPGKAGLLGALSSYWKAPAFPDYFFVLRWHSVSQTGFKLQNSSPVSAKALEPCTTTLSIFNSFIFKFEMGFHVAQVGPELLIVLLTLLSAGVNRCVLLCLVDDLMRV